MRPKVLVSAPYAMPVIDMYKQVLGDAGFDVVVPAVRERLNEAELLAVIADIDGMICGDDEVTPRVLDAATRLRVISKWGTGIDSIDVAAAAARGVAVRNTPNAFSEPVADTVLGYFLLFARKLDVMNRQVHDVEWVKPQLVSLREKTIGVIGVGNCGKAVVRRATAFGARVVGNDIAEVAPEFVAETGVRMVLLDELLAASDFISLNTTLNSTSRYLMNDRTFALMKPAAFIVNTSRGPVIEEAALLRALESGRIGGAALDVFENEPLPASSSLRRFPNCYLAPHNANSSPEAANRVHQNTIRNLISELSTPPS